MKPHDLIGVLCAKWSYTLQSFLDAHTVTHIVERERPTGTTFTCES